MKLLREIAKNFTLIFRNWTTLLLIIIAPLLLILLVGYSLSGEGLHDITIGVVSENDQGVGTFIEQMRGEGEVLRYSSKEQCVFDMQRAKAHLCVLISGDFIGEKDGVPYGDIAVIYDNSRKQVALLLLGQVREFFGLSSEQITLLSTQAVFSNLQNLVTFLQARIGDLENVEKSALEIRADLLSRQQELIEFHSKFEPRYLLVKKVQKEFETQFVRVNSSYGDVQFEMKLLDTRIEVAQIEVDRLAAKSGDFGILFTGVTQSFNSVRKSMATFTNKSDSAYGNLVIAKVSLDGLVGDLDQVNTLLLEDINRTNEYVTLIDTNVKEVSALREHAETEIGSLSRLDENLAARLAKPITQKFSALRADVSNLQFSFPVLLSTIVVFISLLFSTVITVLELYNKAFVRNILAPVNDLLFTLGILLTAFFVVFFQVIILFGVAQFGFGIDIIGSLGLSLLVVILLVVIFLCVGILLAYRSRSVQSAILLSTFSALGFFLLSNSLTPLERMPEVMSIVAQFNPMTLANSALRGILFFGQGVGIEILVLFGYSVVLLVVLFRVSSKRNSERL